MMVLISNHLLSSILIILSSTAFLLEADRISSFNSPAQNTCPCQNQEWCKLITKEPVAEVFAFSMRNDASHWNLFDWSKLTTVVMFGYLNETLMCLAHSHGVRVVMLGNANTSTMLSPMKRSQWVDKVLFTVQANFLDGINFDFENQVLQNETSVRDAYTATVQETYSKLKAINASYQITVDVAWKPNTDSRFYDYLNLSHVSDFLFVMAYDEQSQIFGDCVAGPNSGIDRAISGLEMYINAKDYKINRKKLVLGVPWYGYMYQCLHLQGDKCFIKEVPFRGVACSDASGRQVDYGVMNNIIKTLPIEALQWNKTSQSPYFTFNDFTTGLIHQAQFDNPASLIIKYKLARQLGLRGVGMWNIDSLDYSNTQAGEEVRAEMFGALSAALG